MHRVMLSYSVSLFRVSEGGVVGGRYRLVGHVRIRVSLGLGI